MPLRIRWKATELRPIFDEAIAQGETCIQFANVSEAEKFRLACYKFRNRTGVGREFSFILDPEGADGKPEIQIRRTPVFKLVRKPPTSEPTTGE